MTITFTEVAEEWGMDRYGPVPVGRAAEVYCYEADGPGCVSCGCAIGTVLEEDANGYERARFLTVWEDPLLQGYCEDCAYEIESEALADA